MKKFIQYLTIASMCLLAASCSKDNTPESAADAAQTMPTDAPTTPPPQKEGSENTTTTTNTDASNNAAALDALQAATKIGEDAKASLNNNLVKETKAIAQYDAVAIGANQRVASNIDNAKSLAESGEKVKALQELEDAEKKEPRAFLVQFNKGIIYEWAGQSRAAEQAYLSALKIEPNFSPALENYVRLKVANGDASTAYATASNFVSSNPNAFDHNIARIEAMIGLKNYDGAVLECRRLLKIDEANPRLRYEIAKAEYTRGRYNLAEFVVKESLEIDPDNVDALFLLAKIHFKLSENDSSYATALASELDKVLTKQTRHVEALWMRGVLFYQQSDYTKAEKTFRMLLDIAPNLVQPYINLANVLKTLDRGPEAEELLKKAAIIAPDNAEVDFSFGTLYMNFENIKLPGSDDLDRLNLAKSYFEKAVSHSTDPKEIKLFKGYIRTTDDSIEAIQAMREAEALFAE